MTTRGKVLIAIIVLAGLYFGINKLTSSNLLFKKAETQSVLLNSIELPAATGGNGVNTVVPLAALPGGTARPKRAPQWCGK